MWEKQVTQELTAAIFLLAELLLVHVLQVKLKMVVVATPQQLLLVLGLAQVVVQLTNQLDFVQLLLLEQLLVIVVQILNMELHIISLTQTVIAEVHTLTVTNMVVVARLVDPLLITTI
jgi:hypothetical protein